MVSSLHTIFLLVSDLARSVAFYREFLGRAPSSEDARHARFDLGGISLTVHEDLAPAEASMWRVDPVPAHRGWGAYLSFATDDLERAHSKLTEIGAETLVPPQGAPWVARLLIAKDPDGYLLEVSQGP